MLRMSVLLVLAAALTCAATIRLYLKDGDYQLAREYSVEGDRVRFYSAERGQWEEIPLSLVDLKRTEAEQKEREQQLKKDAALMAAEEKAERAAAEEIARVPVEPGAYLVDGDKIQALKLAESKIVGNKRRAVLKVLTPIPILTGKGSLEIDGAHSETLVNTGAPEFYLRLSTGEHFGIVRAQPAKDARVIEKFDVVPVSKEIVEQQDEVEVFRRQVGDGLYKIWPVKPLAPGEYAVVEFTPAMSNSINMQVWDFAVPPGAKGAAAPEQDKKSRAEEKRKK
jgi:hypothetical protein